jgi:hypothetical protein
MAVSPLGGCVVSHDGGGDVAHVQISWKLVDASLTGNAQETACPQGFDTAALFSQEVDANGAPIGSPIVDLFDCAAGTGITSGLPPSTYNEWVEITDHSGATEYAESPSSTDSGQIIDLTTSDLSYTTQIVNNGGVFALSWDLVGATSNQPLDCATAGASGGVEAIATVSGGTMSADDIFDCNNPTLPLTAPYPAGQYTVSVDALDGNMQAIGTAPTIPNATIVDPATDPTKPVTDLGNITIPIDGM